MISLKIVSTAENVARLQAGAPRIIEALIAKMNSLMIRLQAKVVGESIPTFFKTDAHIGKSVRVVPAEIKGSKLSGYVTAGGVPDTQSITKKSGAQVDWAVVQEYGVGHGWEILPFDKRALAFVIDSKLIITKRVFHPPLEARPFMRSELQNMEGQIVSELNAAFGGAANG